MNCARRVFPFLQLGVKMYERGACVGRSVGLCVVCYVRTVVLLWKLAGRFPKRARGVR